MYRKSLLLLILAGLFIYSCGSEDSSNEIIIDGSSTVFPITKAISEEYRSEAQGIQITVERSGTGGGFQKFLRGDTDINNASREVSEKEKKLAQKNEIEFVQLSVAYDGLAIVVHPDNDWVDYLSVQELREIWQPESQQDITHWNDIRDEWPDEELNLYGPGVASGTYDYFTEVIVGENSESRGDFTSGEDSVLVEEVSSDEGSLGFFGLAYFEKNKEILKLIPVKHGNNEPVKPTKETVSEGSYTPLSRTLFIYVRRESAQRPAVRDFVNFYLENVPELVPDIGYVALPDSVYSLQKEQFKEFYTVSDTSEAE